MLVTYSLTIRRLQLEAAKCFADPDDHLMIKPKKSDGLRRHQSATQRRPLSYPRMNVVSREVSSSTSASLRTPTLADTDDKKNHHQQCS